MQHVVSGIVKMQLPTPYPVGKVNVYFLDGDEPTLIDTGVSWEPSLAALSEQLREHGRRIEDICRILITHGHYDHAGAAFQLSKVCGARISLHERSTLLSRRQPRMIEKLFEFLMRCGMPQFLMSEAGENFKKGGRFADLTTEPHAVERLKGGETIIVNDLSLEALATPGHSPDHLCFLEKTSNILLCGDMLLRRITPNPMLYLDPENDYRRTPGLLQYIDSLKLLKAREISAGYPGHGPTIENVHKHIERNEVFIEKRRTLIFEKTADGPATPYSLANAVFGKLDLMNLFLAISETVAYLDLLERDRQIMVEWSGDPININRVS